MNTYQLVDFFKDYPPVNGSEQVSPSTNDAPAPSDDSGMNAFVLGDSGTNGDEAAPAHDGDLLGTNGGPPPDDDSEPECVTVTEWRAAFAKGLEEKVANERRVKAERAEQARATLESMHSRWDATRRNAEDANIKSEKQFIRTRDGVISRMSNPGESPNWDIIPELVDMTGKYKEGARDTSRMRQVLLRMKTN